MPRIKIVMTLYMWNIFWNIQLLIKFMNLCCACLYCNIKQRYGLHLWPIKNKDIYVEWPPLWSSGQSSWLQIRGSIPGTTKKVVGLERGPLSLVSTTEELLDRKVAAPV
jgi:hypothetical protein